MPTHRQYAFAAIGVGSAWHTLARSATSFALALQRIRLCRFIALKHITTFARFVEGRSNNLTRLWRSSDL